MKKPTAKTENDSISETQDQKRETQPTMTRVPMSSPMTFLRFLTYFIVSVLILAVGAGGMWTYMNKDVLMKRNLAEKQTAAETKGPQTTDSPEVANLPSPTVSPLDGQQPTIAGVDASWNEYTNPILGFSMQIPKQMMAYYGQCQWSDQNGDHSFRPVQALVPVTVFENGNSVFITTQYYYELGGETQENNRSYFASCDQVQNSLALVQDQSNTLQQKWELVFADVATNQELDNFIKSEYGQGCGLGQQTPSQQQGVMDVKIDTGNFDDLEQAEANGCLVNYVYVIKYDPDKQKAVSWKMGQAMTFIGEDGLTGFDTSMKDSFRFE